MFFSFNMVSILSDNLGWVSSGEASGRNIFYDYASGSNHASGTDENTANNDAARANPHVVADNNGFSAKTSNKSLFWGFHRKIMPMAIKYLAVGGDKAVFSDTNFFIGMQTASMNDRVVPDGKNCPRLIGHDFHGGEYLNVMSFIPRVKDNVITDSDFGLGIKSQQRTSMKPDFGSQTYGLMMFEIKQGGSVEDEIQHPLGEMQQSAKPVQDLHQNVLRPYLIVTAFSV